MPAPADADTTVRQTPFTARLSPGRQLAPAIAVVSRSRKPAGARLDLGHFADRFNQPGEHHPPPARRRRASCDATIVAAAATMRRRSHHGSPPGPSGAASCTAGRGPRARRPRAPRCSVGPPSTTSELHAAVASRVERAPMRRRRASASRISESRRPGAGARRRSRRQPRRCSVTIMTGPASSVESTRAAGGVRSRRSKIDARQRPVRGRRRAAVSSGSSASTVPDPTAIASTSARSRWITPVGRRRRSAACGAPAAPRRSRRR